MEEEVFYLMETWGLSETDIKKMPSSRRYRMVHKKIELERLRHEAAKKRR